MSKWACYDDEEDEDAYDGANGGEVDESVQLDKDMLIDGVQVLSERLGYGGFGTVYRATWYGTPVAVKQIHDSVSPEHGQRPFFVAFGEEWHILRRLRHPYIVQFLGVFAPKGRRPYLVMERMQTTLRRRSQRDPFLSERDTIRVCVHVICALCYLHAQGVVHRDLTTNNVLLTRGEAPIAKVSDLGVARALYGDSPSEKAKSLVSCTTRAPGTLLYMSPESLDPSGCSYNEKHDIFSYGVLVLATCVHHEPSCAFEPLRQIADGSGNRSRRVPESKRRFTDLKDMPDEHPLRGIVVACLADDPNSRPSAADLLNRLECMPGPTRPVRDSLKGYMSEEFSTPPSSLPVDQSQRSINERAKDAQRIVEEKMRLAEAALERAREVEGRARVAELAYPDRLSSGESPELRKKLKAAEQQAQDAKSQAESFKKHVQMLEKRLLMLQDDVQRAEQAAATALESGHSQFTASREAEERAMLAEKNLCVAEQKAKYLENQVAMLQDQLTRASQANNSAFNAQMPATTNIELEQKCASLQVENDALQVQVNALQAAQQDLEAAFAKKKELETALDQAERRLVVEHQRNESYLQRLAETEQQFEISPDEHLAQMTERMSLEDNSAGTAAGKGQLQARVEYLQKQVNDLEAYRLQMSLYENDFKDAQRELEKVIKEKDDWKERCQTVMEEAQPVLGELQKREKQLSDMQVTFDKVLEENKKLMAANEALRKEKDQEVEMYKFQAETYRRDFDEERSAREELNRKKEDLLQENEMLKQQMRLGVDGSSHGHEQRRKPAPSAPYETFNPDSEQADPYQCPRCQRGFNTFAQLQVHVTGCTR